MVGHKVLSEESHFCVRRGCPQLHEGTPLIFCEAVRRPSLWNCDAGCFPGSSSSHSYRRNKEILENLLAGLAKVRRRRKTHISGIRENLAMKLLAPAHGMRKPSVRRSAVHFNQFPQHPPINSRRNSANLPAILSRLACGCSFRYSHISSAPRTNLALASSRFISLPLLLSSFPTPSQGNRI